jgi:diguanylate cyclase (GGDEF)-like protein
MPLRFSLDARMIAAFAASAAVLLSAAWFVVSTGRAYLDAEERADAGLYAQAVLPALSSTIDAARRPDNREVLPKRVPDAVAGADNARAAARRMLGAVETALAVFAALTVVACSAAAAVLLRLLRERARLADRVQSELNHDPLTGLPNRRFFAEWLSFAIAHARRESAHVGVLYIDINGCAAVAELHGGPAVEALLVDIARRFRAAAREGDVFARLAASEFALATPNARHTRDLAMLAQRLRDALNDPVQAPLADTPIGTSIGIAFFPEDADDGAGVMAAANAAMYAARRAGRNHVAFNALAA